MIKKWVGDKKSITARSENGQIWTGELFDTGRETKFSDATLAEVEELAAQHHMQPASPRA